MERSVRACVLGSMGRRRGVKGAGERERSRCGWGEEVAHLPSPFTFGDAISRDEMSASGDEKNRGESFRLLSLPRALSAVSKVTDLKRLKRQRMWTFSCPCVYIERDNKHHLAAHLLHPHGTIKITSASSCPQSTYIFCQS